jgi:peptidyl-prolyl cis-trans isomerase B (cyclophilin B)
MAAYRDYACRVSADRLLASRFLTLFAVGAMSVVMTACGGSASNSSAANASSTGVKSSASTGAAQTAPAGCSSVSVPAAKGPQHIAAPTLKLDPSKRYVVSMSTNCGAIEILLDVQRAPKTASSFAYLVKRGFYNGLTFHRVAAGFVIQGGDPNGDGSGGPGYTVVERPPANLKYTLGTVAMAKAGTEPAGSSGSQFFIVTATQTPLPPQYALVGKVVGGLAGVRAISKIPTTPPEDGAPTSPVVISRATLTSG